MLTSDLQRVKVKDGKISPRLIDTSKKRYREKAEHMLELYREHLHQPRGRLDEAIRDYIGDGTDYLISRGFAKLLADRSTFEVTSPVDPRELRKAIFELMAQHHPVPEEADIHYPVSREQILTQVGEAHELSAQQVDDALYADLQDAYVMTEFDDTTPAALLTRYNLALAQALLFRATHLKVELWNASAQRLRQVMRYIKFFRLIAWIKPLAANRYSIELDGPMSLFRFCQKYGLQMANFLPALLLCEDWSLEAEIKWEDQQPPLQFVLDSDTELQSHYPNKGVYVTDEEAYFRKRWKKFKLSWELENKAKILRLGTQDVIVTDYVLKREDGEEVMLYLVGFWQKHALQKRIALLEEYGPPNLIVAAPAKLRASQDDWESDFDRLYFFKDVIHPKRIAELADEICGSS